MKNNKTFIICSLILCFAIINPSVAQFKVNKDFKKLIPKKKDDLSTTEVTKGLKEALVKGVTKGAKKASATDGFNKNKLIRIPFPDDMQKVKNKLNSIGMSKLVNDFELSLNRAAEKSAKKATPIFVNAINTMSVDDARGVLKGGNRSATTYLKKTTTNDLTDSFNPVVKESLDEADATKYFDQIVTRYNKIPFVDKVNPNLEEYATEKTIDGLFTLVGQEEEKIRKDPAARTSDTMKKVFNKDNW